MEGFGDKIEEIPEISLPLLYDSISPTLVDPLCKTNDEKIEGKFAMKPN